MHVHYSHGIVILMLGDRVAGGGVYNENISERLTVGLGNILILNMERERNQVKHNYSKV